ncbi:TlpA disulfide reductase family protein [Acinetobacter chinensis]|jgi:thiol-disulfide isomerase/thioredoxin|uniref:TlpA disulfide reductase family protein n=1 Tax=Acinetobacter chinensis TaxID=2004650 RepID=UPI002935083B|nr:TlpA disulfide reductase family protein [Acinetobacter chinensis]WOE40004.1 TlpA disulfide reductase family protein [Acinetobacter chinensis]
MFSAQAIHLGMFIIPWTLIIGLVSLLFSLLIAARIKNRFQLSEDQWTQLKDSIWTAILVGLCTARIGFVLLNHDLYLSHPLQMIQIQDKGFNVWIGAACATGWIIWKNRRTSRAFLMIFMAVLITSVTVGQYAIHQVQKQQQQFPQITLMGLDQKSYSLDQFYGKPVVINLWASWCPPCHREMPVLEKAQTDYPDVQFVMINQSESAQTVQQYLQKNQLSFQHMLMDPSAETAYETGMYGLPSTLFYNAQGELKETHMGEISPAVLRQKLNSIIEEK